MSDFNSDSYSTNKSSFMIGCGCRTVKDVIAFMKEKKIEYIELAWGMFSQLLTSQHECIP